MFSPRSSAVARLALDGLMRRPPPMARRAFGEARPAYQGVHLPHSHYTSVKRAHAAHICCATGLGPPTSAPGVGLRRRHRHRGCAVQVFRPQRHRHQAADDAQVQRLRARPLRAQSPLPRMRLRAELPRGAELASAAADAPRGRAGFRLPVCADDARAGRRGAARHMRRLAQRRVRLHRRARAGGQRRAGRRSARRRARQVRCLATVAQ
jgi:hypothetical protein